MEHMHKSLATATSQAQGACADPMVDRLSSVPCEVAHQILSLVAAIALAGISEESFRMMTWILIAVRCNVEVLDLELRLNTKDGATPELPPCIYCCESLRSMLINTETILKAPSFACSNNLQYLKLTSVRMDDGFGKWISGSCKCIKELLLDNVHVGSFTIESSSLESFTLLYCHNNDRGHFSISGEKLAGINIEWENNKASSSITRSLNVYAPNLKYLKWIGNLLNYQDLGKFMCLEKAHIFLKRQGDDYDLDNAFEVLCSFYRVKSLVLSEETIKVKIHHPSEFRDSFLFVETRDVQ